MEGAGKKFANLQYAFNIRIYQNGVKILWAAMT